MGNPRFDKRGYSPTGKVAALVKVRQELMEGKSAF
jgi:hypothetical protein